MMKQIKIVHCKSFDVVPKMLSADDVGGFRKVLQCTDAAQTAVQKERLEL